MNLLKLFKEEYIAIDKSMNDRFATRGNKFNDKKENDIFKMLNDKISEPIRKNINFDLGEVYFVNDIDEEFILIKFSRLNVIYSTSQSLNNIVNEIKNAPIIAYV